jgi:hypothetical protein
MRSTEPVDRMRNSTASDAGNHESEIAKPRSEQTCGESHDDVQAEAESIQQKQSRRIEQEKLKKRDEEENRREMQRNECFQLIGECYVHNMMDGEAWGVKNIYREIRDFTIV